MRIQRIHSNPAFNANLKITAPEEMISSKKILELENYAKFIGKGNDDDVILARLSDVKTERNNTNYLLTIVACIGGKWDIETNNLSINKLKSPQEQNTPYKFMKTWLNNLNEKVNNDIYA